ncbi:MAG: hypothetical protein ABIU63_18015 [Chitinophagaceae bacterium]
MIKKLLLITGASLFGGASFSQILPGDSLSNQSANSRGIDHYAVKASVEIPMLAVAAAFNLYNFSRISKKTNSDPAYVLGLNKKDVNWFGRWGVRAYSEKKDNAIYLPFFAAMPSPLIFFVFDKKMRKDFLNLLFYMPKP